MNEELNSVLKALLNDVPADIEVPEEDYQKWKADYEHLPEHEKVFNLLGVLSQYLTSGGRTAASMLAVAIICTDRWCNEKDLEDF